MTLTPALSQGRGSIAKAWLWCGWAFVVLVVYLSLTPIASGGPELAHELEREGYDKYARAA